ncbi:MAG: hypothetical protein ACOC8M_03405 [Guyparkeria sp.]
MLSHTWVPHSRSLYQARFRIAAASSADGGCGCAGAEAGGSAWSIGLTATHPQYFAFLKAPEMM